MLSDDTPAEEPAGRRRIDTIAAPEFLRDLESLETAEIRRRRELAAGVEAELSYHRRLLHGRLDLLTFESRRRAGEETRGLIDALPEILGGDARGEPGHVTADSTDLVLPSFEGPGRRSIDFALGDDFLSRLPDLSEAELSEIRETLENEERTTSAQRSVAQEAQDALAAEMGRRYRQGITSVDELFSN